MASRIGIVCSGTPAKLRESERDILQKVGKVVEKYPDATYVCFEKRSDRMTNEALEFWGVTPEVLILDPAWQRVEVAVRDGEWNGRHYKAGDRVVIYDHRKSIRDNEMKRCDKVLVFAPRGGSAEWRDYIEKWKWRDYIEKWNKRLERFPSLGPCNVFLAEYGEAPPPRARTRRPKKKAKAFG
jgi:hypothetical protein